MTQTIAGSTIPQTVESIVQKTPVVDIHTHLYSAGFRDLLLWGIDELLNYHYLQAETFRFQPDLAYQTFWQMTKTEQADLIWKTLFVDHSPISEACRGVITVLNTLGLDTTEKDLGMIRPYFAEKPVEEFIDRVFEIANVKYVVMTNNIFDEVEYAAWQQIGSNSDRRFKGSLRVDGLVNQYVENLPKLRQWGYDVNEELSGNSIAEIQRFLEEWIEKTESVYVNCTFTPDFAYPDGSVRTKILEQGVLPVLEARKLGFSMMVGVYRQVNPQLQAGGDSVGKSDIRALERLAYAFPGVQFLA
ncbi:glucuronate isomerase, partial [candidate division KSB3 bacterium]|nr:glucuronate isomerase [candidate division KSB3 bacterium]MBD3324844.1 glucuronate isomerase [candidate division KSB3 bacterium]